MNYGLTNVQLSLKHTNNVWHSYERPLRNIKSFTFQDKFNYNLSPKRFSIETQNVFVYEQIHYHNHQHKIQIHNRNISRKHTNKKRIYTKIGSGDLHLMIYEQISLVLMTIWTFLVNYGVLAPLAAPSTSSVV